MTITLNLLSLTAGSYEGMAPFESYYAIAASPGPFVGGGGMYNSPAWFVDAHSQVLRDISATSVQSPSAEDSRRGR